MVKNKISLIGTSQGGREAEIERLFKSLVGSKEFLEIIFVDQSNNSNIKNIVTKYKNKIDIKLIFSEKLSLSKARNLALKNCSGNVIGFCDDDAFYDFEFLENLSLLSYDSNKIVSFPILDKSSMKAYGNRNYPLKNKRMNHLNILRYSLSVGTFVFLHNSIEISFNEDFGVGAKFGGSEETELFFRLKSYGFKSEFHNDFGVYHDNDKVEKDENNLDLKYYLYAQGYAVVIKRYMRASMGLLLIELISTILRSTIGIIVRFKQRDLYIGRLKGFLKGLLS
jgi:glycosyltransferase involved in cell wall biosynthesis